ncbi:uncharacterized protein ARMOST_20021 [Armillaria ostoyae]|uniref:Uncharacterized protein n=1 Tax=Armillaria ostoyae TaxID=47428 RepID=A0A284S669_ARMOS|nr:uncharacterized protein ARMOST_20021 [Armillaria ostoyae]
MKDVDIGMQNAWYDTAEGSVEGFTLGPALNLLVSVWSIIAELPEMGWQQQNHRTVEALLRRRKLEHSLEPCGQAVAFPDSHCEDTEEEYFDAEDDEEAEDIELDDDAEAELDEICDDDNEMRLELDLSFAAL